MSHNISSHVIIDGNTFIFPQTIGFENTSGYLERLDKIDEEKEIIIDLTQTSIIHSSFIGFLIDLKRRIERNDGTMKLKASSHIESLLRRIDLDSFFNLPDYS